MAVGADAKWIQNARRILGWVAKNDPSEARWLGLVHALAGVLGCPLAEAVAIADQALAAPIDQRTARVHLAGTGRVELTIDLWRDLTMDHRTLHSAPTLTLVTREGDPTVLDRVEGVGAYAAAATHSDLLEAFGIQFPILDLLTLIRAKRATGRPKDREALLELELLRAERRKS